jgi:hypothetical protein
LVKVSKPLLKILQIQLFMASILGLPLFFQSRQHRGHFIGFNGSGCPGIVHFVRELVASEEWFDRYRKDFKGRDWKILYYAIVVDRDFRIGRGLKSADFFRFSSGSILQSSAVAVSNKDRER